MATGPDIRIWYVSGLSLCNFDCAYCASGVPGLGGGRTNDREWRTPNGREKFGAVLEWVARQPFNIGLRLQSIGEPMVSRDFLRGAARMTLADNIRFVELVTNGSLLRKRLPKLLNDYGADASRLSLWITHHFTEISTHDFIDQVCYARDLGIELTVNTLLFPDNAEAVQETAAACRSEDIKLNVDIGHNFNGAYKEKLFFPAADDPVANLLPDLGVDARMIHSTFIAAFAPTGLPCSSGHDYFHIFPNGNVFPCRTYRALGRGAFLGSALDKSFTLRARDSHYAPCASRRSCMCKEDFLHLRSARDPNYAENKSLALGYPGESDPKLDSAVAARLKKRSELEVMRVFASGE